MEARHVNGGHRPYVGERWTDPREWDAARSAAVEEILARIQRVKEYNSEGGK